MPPRIRKSRRKSRSKPRKNSRRNIKGGDDDTDVNQIKEFCNNCETAIINEIQEKLSEIRVQAQIKPLTIKATEEQVQKGVPETYNVPVTFDNSNFFG